MSLLGMLSLKLGRSVQWDGEAERVINDDEANAPHEKTYHFGKPCNSCRSLDTLSKTKTRKLVLVAIIITTLIIFIVAGIMIIAVWDE